MIHLLSLLFAKDVFVFFDGTGNTKESNTNIYKMFNHFPGTVENNTFTGPIVVTSFIKRQTNAVALYLNGIGTTESKTLRNVQGLTGTGLEGWVLVAYDFLVKELTAQDKLRIFGFSRGAATARILSHYLNDFGISMENLKKERISKTLLDPSVPSVVGWVPKITFLGIFDSVSSINTLQNVIKVLGANALRKRSLFSGISKAFQSVEDAKLALMAKKLVKYTDVLGNNVEKCSHAVALNEYRVLFNYSAIDVANPKFNEGYVAGAHGDIGGGFLFDRSNIALDWMLGQGNLRSFFPKVFRAGYDPVAAATQFPIFDSYTEPSPTTQLSKSSQLAVPVFYRSFGNIKSYHSSAVSLSNFLKVSSNQIARRETILPVLRLRQDYISGNTSIAAAQK